MEINHKLLIHKSDTPYICDKEIMMELYDTMTVNLHGTSLGINTTLISLIWMLNFILLLLNTLQYESEKTSNIGFQIATYVLFGKTFKTLRSKCCFSIHDDGIDFTRHPIVCRNLGHPCLHTR